MLIKINSSNAKLKASSQENSQFLLSISDFSLWPPRSLPWSARSRWGCQAMTVYVPWWQAHPPARWQLLWCLWCRSRCCCTSCLRIVSTPRNPPPAISNPFRKKGTVKKNKYRFYLRTLPPFMGKSFTAVWKVRQSQVIFLTRYRPRTLECRAWHWTRCQRLLPLFQSVCTPSSNLLCRRSVWEQHCRCTQRRSGTSGLLAFDCFMENSFTLVLNFIKTFSFSICAIYTWTLSSSACVF